MPGILPMKVIKVGTSSQSRIAQACDRCRSKKIRCDGIRPCCSQCANVGFECRTSDKLSRRAFPRGYTESLEERVRQLESEVRELKDLLDEKDEKIDMLAKMHSNHRHSSLAAQTVSSPAPVSAPASPADVATGHADSISCQSSTSSASSASSAVSAASSATSATSTTPASSLSPGPAATEKKKCETIIATSMSISAAHKAKREARASAEPIREDTFRVQASPLLLGVENSDSYFMGASSGRSFIETLKRRMQESGKSCSDFHSEAFLHIQGCYPLVENMATLPLRVPPRIFTDRCVNVHFQEWSPLFPILHRPAFLRIYDDFVSDPDKIKNHHKLAQLYLVFAIAGLSSDQPDLEQVAICERQWQRSLEAILMDNTIITLQCLVLALLYCAVRADYRRLQYYKGIAVSLSHRLGLHQSQKRFSFGALTIETRKKVFWTLYTLDCFSAAVLGLPKLMREDDIHTEYPTDTDDEYVTEKGFQPTLPGEFTRVSAALALFRAARILAKVLEANYPAAATYELSLQQMCLLETELTEWRDSLPPHLTLTFRQEKPSTDVTGNRSPLLSLTYYYIRTLIWRPAVGSSLGPKAAPALMAISESSKHMVQIIELLEERKMSFSLCLNKPDLLILCGMMLLYQSMALKPDSKMMKDIERLVNSALKIADRTKAPGWYDFVRVAAMLVTVDDPPAAPTSVLRPSSESGMTAPARRASQSSLQHRKAQAAQFALGRHSSSASVSETDLLLQQDKLRRMTMATGNPVSGGLHIKTEPRSRSRSSFDALREHMSQQRLSLSQAQMLSRLSQLQQQRMQKNNLDYLAMDASEAPRVTQQQQQQQQFFPSQKASVSPTDWEALLGSMDGGQMNVYDAIYGGPAIGLGGGGGEQAAPPSTTSQSGDGWSPESWDLSGFTLGDVGDPGSSSSGPGSVPAPAQSVLSFSDESMSGDDLGPTELASLGLGNLDIGNLDYHRNGLLNGGCGATPEGFVIEGLDSNFVL